MIELFERGVEVVNATIAIAVLCLVFRIVPSLSFGLQKRAVWLFLASTLFFTVGEILNVVSFLLASEKVGLLKEFAETSFIVCVAVAVYLLYQSEHREVAMLRQSAETDALTMLYNNDQFGHEAGNIVLRCVADVLREWIRADDLVARYGGEEFVALISSGPEATAAVAERIRSGVESRCSPDCDVSWPRQITVSLGVASLTPQIKTLEELIEAADREMYHAKRAGKNQVSVAGGGTA